MIGVEIRSKTRVDIFIATAIKSFDLNPTHPGPVSRTSFHTWLADCQQTERSARSLLPTKQLRLSRAREAFPVRLEATRVGFELEFDESCGKRRGHMREESWRETCL